MSSIFVNYRSGSHSISVSALAERLAAHFGPDRIFVDHQMEYGTRYPDELRAHLWVCEVLVTVIHKDWVSDLEDRMRRGGLDWVRYEIATALQQGKAVVQVLLEDCAPPTPDALPEDIRELALRQAARLRAAHWAEDLERLLVTLDRYVAPDVPPPARPEPERKPLWPAVTLRAVGALLLPLVIAGALGAKWIDFASVAMLSQALMLLATGLLGLERLTRRLVYRWERRTGVRPFRDYMTEYVYLAIVMMLGVGVLIRFVRQGWDWPLEFSGMVLVIFVYFIQRILVRRNRQESEWPPQPSLEPYLFRRAAARLYDRLTADPEWGPRRSRLRQLQAVQVYFDLAETKLALAQRTAWGWRQWLAAGPTTVPANYIGWALSIIALLVTAVALYPVSRGAGPQVPLMVASLVLLTAAVAIAAVALDRTTHRLHDTLLVAELTRWQATLGPLVFHRDHRASPADLPEELR